MSKNINIKNRKASFEYFFIKDFVAGIELLGSEVKSIINGKISLNNCFCYFKENEIYLKGANISPIGTFPHDPTRDRKLLLKRKEINNLIFDLETGMTVVVKRIFSNERGKIKVEIALAKGKKNYDKRQSIKERDLKRELRNI